MDVQKKTQTEIVATVCRAPAPCRCPDSCSHQPAELLDTSWRRWR
ncbi:hypothetical protein [Streptomyces thioluteus]